MQHCNITESLLPLNTNTDIQNGLRPTMLGTSEVFEFTYLLCKTFGKAIICSRLFTFRFHGVLSWKSCIKWCIIITGVIVHILNTFLSQK